MIAEAHILVTGGAGYIGSVVAEELLKEDYGVAVLDNLQQGHKRAVPAGADFILADICDAEALEKVFGQFKIEAVVHIAAEALVAHSMTDPKPYFQNNVVGGINLLNAMVNKGASKLIFSSTCAVYGEPQVIPIREEHSKNPVNAYGESKLAFERILEWYGRAYGLQYVSLRYFNAAGANKHLGEDHNPETHLIPNIIKVALGLGDHVPIFGTDYPTKDGSCIRDYIHVLDIAKAHILALQHLERNEGNKAYNLGNGEGYSVLEVVETARKVTGVDIPAIVRPRRAGDPAVLVAGSELAKAELGWQSAFPSLESILESAWRWHRDHPQGYNK